MIFLLQSILIGFIATLLMDIFSLFRQRFFNVKSLDFAWVGRWLMTMKTGQFTHHTILQSPHQPFEKITGWFFHYAIGMVWAGLYLVVVQTYAIENLLISAMLLALVTSLAPFLLMQPMLGFGFFASKTPSPITSIKNSLISHGAFGLGLYLSYSFIFSLHIE